MRHVTRDHLRFHPHLAIDGIAGITRKFLIISPLAEASLIAVDKTGS